MWKHPVMALAVISLGACGMIAEVGNGTKETQAREAVSFQKVENESSLDVLVHVGGEAQVEVTVDSNLQAFVDVEVVGEVLRVTTSANLHYSGVGQVEITVPQLTGVSHGGSGEMRVDGRQSPLDLAVSASGSGSMSVCTDVTALAVNHSGSGALDLCVPAGGAALTRLTLASGGSGGVTWTGDADEADVTHSGSGGLKLTGRGDSLTLVLSGSGSSDAKDFPVTTATVSLTSSGSLKATVTGTAALQLSGSGSAEVWGGAELDVVNTGSGSVFTR